VRVPVHAAELFDEQSRGWQDWLPAFLNENASFGPFKTSDLGRGYSPVCLSTLHPLFCSLKLNACRRKSPRQTWRRVCSLAHPLSSASFTGNTSALRVAAQARQANWSNGAKLEASVRIPTSGATTNLPIDAQRSKRLLRIIVVRSLTLIRRNVNVSRLETFNFFKGEANSSAKLKVFQLSSFAPPTNRHRRYSPSFGKLLRCEIRRLVFVCFHVSFYILIISPSTTKTGEAFTFPGCKMTDVNEEYPSRPCHRTGYAPSTYSVSIRKII